jgi:hypothetical protein
MTERRIVEYRFARVSDLEYDGCLSTSVEHWLDVGYQPFGPLVAFEPDQSKWVQPMVRYAEPEPTRDDEQDAEIERLRAEVERLRAENKRLSEENVDWHSCVITDILMSGPVFTGGSRSALLRCFERYIRGAALADQTGGEG